MDFPALSLDDPKTQGILALAAGLLKASGPSPYPVGIGAALGQGGMAGLGAYNESRQQALRQRYVGLQADQMQEALAAQKRTQGAIDAMAAQLPEDKRALFLANPGEYIKSTTALHPLSPGQRLVSGGGSEVAAVPPNLQPVNLGGSTGAFNPASGGIQGAPTPHTIPPQSLVINPEAQAKLYLQAAQSDPMGMFGLRSIVDKYVHSSAAPAPVGVGGAGAPNAQPTMLPSGAKIPGVGSIDPAVHGEDYLNKVPKPIADQVKALAEGRMPFPGGFALKSPYWQNMITMVSQYDPSFDAVNYASRAATRKDFTSGPTSKNITSLNTVIGHMDSLDKAIDALGNGNYPLVNKVMQTVGSQVNPEYAGKIRTFEQAKEAVSNELMRVFRGTGASTSDTQRWAATIGQADSPTALKAAVKGAVDLLHSRIGALDEQYKRGMGTTADVMDLINPKAKEALSRLGGEQKSTPGIKFLGFEK